MKDKLKVLLTKLYFDSDKHYINNLVSDIADLVDTKDYSETGLLKEIEKVDVLFGSFVSDKLLANAKNLKLIQIPWTGVDNLNYELLRKYNIPVCNSHSNSEAVAEHAFSLLLSLLKKIPYHDKLMRQGDWNRPKKDILSVYDNFSDKLQGKSVLFIGYGSIAKKIAHYLLPFNCEISAVDESDNMHQELRSVYKPSELDIAINKHDIIFVTVPYTEKTNNLLDESRFSKFRSTSYLINISRGNIVNGKALYEALLNNQIAGAAVDVWYNYPKADQLTYPSLDFPFHELNNLIMSPHRAGFIKGELPHLDDAIENIKRLYDGKALINLIDLNKKY